MTDGNRPTPPLDEGEEPRSRTLLHWLPVILFGLVAVLMLYMLGVVRTRPGGEASQVPSALIGRPVPRFALASLPGLAAGGQPVPGLSTPDLMGRVTLVNVWASWCGPCREEHPILMELAKDPSVRVVGINYKDNPENARRFLGALGNPFTAVGVDPNGRAAIDWGVYGVPETFVIGPDGTIRHKHIGPLTPEAMPGFLEKVKAAGAAG